MAKNGFMGWPVLLIIILASVGIGFFLGRMDLGSMEEEVAEQGEEQVITETEGTDEQTAQANESVQGEAAKKGISSEELAKQKGVPESVKSPQGDYALIAVIEGEEANRALQGGLQTVTAQRRNLAILTQRINQMDPKLAQQRELLAGQINETRQALEQNLRFMARNFGYSLANNYLLVPHRATLNSVIGSGQDQLKTLVYTFKDATSYEKFQQQTNAYSQLKRAQLRDYRETQTEEEKKQPMPKLPLTGEMEKMRQQMVDTYECDPERTYVIEIQKAALYARGAQ